MAQSSITNDRIFYACQAVAITPEGHRASGENMVHGLQSVGMSTTFTLDQAFEMGQIQIYENIEELAECEVTLEKVIDGKRLLYLMGSHGAGKTDLVAASKKKSMVYLAIYSDGASQIGSGTIRSVCMNSGMFLGSVSYTYPTDGSATESVSFVGHDRFWNAQTASGSSIVGVSPTPSEMASGTAAFMYSSGIPVGGGEGLPSGVAVAAGAAVKTDFAFDGTDASYGSSKTFLPTGGVATDRQAGSGIVRRKNVDITASTLPSEVATQGFDSAAGEGKSGGHHISSISVSTDFSTESINELGRFGPYTRYASFPIEVTSEFEVTATSGDLISISGADARNRTSADQSITIKDDAGTVLYLGTQNKLSSVNYSGGDTGGGNATITFSYSNFNVLTVNGGGTYLQGGSATGSYV